MIYDGDEVALFHSVLIDPFQIAAADYALHSNERAHLADTYQGHSGDNSFGLNTGDDAGAADYTSSSTLTS